MKVEFDPANPEDVSRVLVLLGVNGNVTTTTEVAEADTPAPAKKTASPRRAAKKAEPEPEPEPVTEDEDLVGGDDEPEADEVTMADCVKAATALVNADKASALKKALTEFGAKKVSDLDEDQLAPFLAELKNA